MNQKIVASGAIEEVRQMQLQKEKRYMTVKEWCANVGYLPEGGIRHLIFSNPEFCKRIVRRVGRKILLDCSALEQFIAEQNGR
ncbi:MAG: hypothetical protein LLG04_08970 [Parachlamydia sp.]|nr:hypothetical protein [Parachlamydia sp.]